MSTGPQDKAPRTDKTMKAIYRIHPRLTLGLAALAISLVTAQVAVAKSHGGDRDCSHRRGKGGLAHKAVHEALNLSPEQRDQIRSIREDARQKMRALRSDNTLDREAKRPQIHAIKNEMRRAMKQVLRPEQAQRWEELKKERAAKRQKRRLERLTQALELSAEQKAKIKVILEDTHRKMKAIKDSDAENKREQFEALRNHKYAAIAELLNDEQKERFKKLREDRKRGKRGPRGWGKKAQRGYDI